MSSAEAGTWKLLIYPMIIILLVGAVLGFVLAPFVEDEATFVQYASINANNSNYSETFNALQTTINTGNPFNISVISIPLIVTTIDISLPNIFTLFGSPVKDFLISEIIIFAYIPLWLLIPIEIIFLVSFIYVLWYLMASLIP